MSKYRLYSMLAYGVAALAGALMLLLTTFTAFLVVVALFAAAAAADRFLNTAAEPDERLRSFMLYGVGMIVGLALILMFASQLGAWTWVAPLVGFGLLAVVDYLKPPAQYVPRDPHRYGESPPVTVR
jgi:hypothetical protein